MFVVVGVDEENISSENLLGQSNVVVAVEDVLAIVEVQGEVVDGWSHFVNKYVSGSSGKPDDVVVAEGKVST